MRRERALQRIQVKSKILTRHSGTRAKPASPESITTAGGYGFRPSPLSRLGRNDKLNGLIIGALHRIRDNTPRTRSQPYSLVKQHMFLRSRGAFLRPGFACCGFAHPNEGWRSAEITLGCSGTRGRALTRHARRLARRLASLGRRSPLGAPPWRFWAPVPRFPHRQLSLACASASNRIGHSELLASGS